MSNELKNLTARKAAVRKNGTPPHVRTPGRTDEVRNNDGAFVFKVSDKDRLERFLILGTDAGTFYVGKKALTKANAKVVSDLIKTDERMVVDTIVDVSLNGRAAKQSPAIYALAVVLVEGKDKAYAAEALKKVCRTATHLYEFVQYVDDLGGWGRAKRNAVAGWFDRKPEKLAYQAVKYRQRNGWTMRDVMRLSHPQGVDKTVGNFILGKETDLVVTGAPVILQGFKEMQAAKSAKEVLRVIGAYPELPWETIPTEFLKDPQVWKTLFYAGALGQTALLRNVTRFARIGAFDDVKFAGDVAKALQDKEAIANGRVHPIAYLNALYIYRDGQLQGDDYWGSSSRKKDWKTNAKVAGGIEAGFYNAFGNIEPANKRTMVSIDVSGSMTWAGPAGLVGLDARQAAAAMAMVLIRSEPYVVVNAFSTSLVDAGISDADSLESVQNKIDNIRMGATDCSLPMVVAKAQKLEIETFVVITDSETNSGRIKPATALKQYRDASGVQSRLVVIGMTATDFTIGDPKDKSTLDVVGFDASAPGVIAAFSAGRI